MKTGNIKIQGKEYILCLSPRVLKNLQEKTGNSIYDELEKLDKNFDIGEVIWLLSEMLIAGDKYATKNGIPHTTPIPSEDDLLDDIGIDDYSEMFLALANAISNGTSADLKVKSKNATTTLQEATE